MRQPKFIIGQPVEFNKDRIVGSEDGTRLENVQGLYTTLDFNKGKSGVITGVSTDYQEAENYKDALNSGLPIDPSAIYYTVRVGLTPIYMVPEYDLDGVVDLKAKVEEKLQKAQESKEFKDVGTRIGGTKKEKMAYKMILTSDLNEIEKSEVLARELVKKDKVYPKVDIAKEQEKGTSAGTAFLKVKLREAFPSQPADNRDKRKVYVTFAEMLVKEFSEVLTIEEFTKTRSKLGDNALRNIIYSLLSPEMQEKLEESEKNTEQYAELLLKQKQSLESEKLELFEKYKEGSQWNSSYFSVDEKAHPDYREITNKIYELSERIDFAKKGITEIEVDAVKSITEKSGIGGGYYRDRKYLGQYLFKELFGSRFYNFIYKYGDPVYKTYDDAQNFEAISEEQSKAILEKYNVPNKARLAEIEENIKFIESRPSLQELKEYFSQKSRGSTGFHRSNFPENLRKEHIYWEDVSNNAPMAEIYANTHKNRLIKQKADLEKSIADYNEKFKPKESDWSWSGVKKRAEGEGTQKSELTVNRYPPLDHIKRTGGYLVTDSDVTVESIVNNFNFKSVTLGNYVKDKEAREHIRHFLGAMADLGDILNIDIKYLNDLLGLSLWFGAGGYGKAGAYYRANGVVINLTKTNGDGAVAHEYAHYLDNAFALKYGVKYGGSGKDRSFISDMKKSGYSYTQKLDDIDVNESLTAIFRYIYDRKLPLNYSRIIDGKEVSAIEINKQVKIKEVIPAQSKSTYRIGLKGENIDEALNYFFSSYPSFKMHENLSKRDRDILGFIIHKFGHKEYEIEFDTRRTAYYANSAKMSSEYWTQPWELFARAFETYIYDKLEKAGRTNNYLVAGSYFDRPEGVYPQGMEREILYDLYDEFFKTAKFVYKIPDYQSWTTERVDEYVDLSTNSKGEEDTVAAVISDSETGETVEIIDDNAKVKMKDKLKRFAEYLSEQAKFEKGGIIFGQLVHHIKNKS